VIRQHRDDGEAAQPVDRADPLTHIGVAHAPQVHAPMFSRERDKGPVTNAAPAARRLLQGHEREDVLRFLQALERVRSPVHD
jgi:hypothetical protein